jgi:hypothetical protein
MSNLMPKDIKEEVKGVLENMCKNSKGCSCSYLTAYQILERLSSETRERLIAERGDPGLGSGNYYAAASAVSDAAEMLADKEIAFLETSSLRITLKNGTEITPGNQNVGLYRLQK